MKLSEAQVDALSVLAGAEDGALVGGWRRRSQAVPFRRVNMIAASSLVRGGLVKRHLSIRSSPFAHTDTYEITDAGREALTGDSAQERP